MILRIFGHKFHFECENICRLFYPNEKISIVYDFDMTDSKIVETYVTDENEFSILKVKAYIDGKTFEKTNRIISIVDFNRDNRELELAILIFKCLSEATEYMPPWGVLTGIRPSKLFLNLESEFGKDRAYKIFSENFKVEKEKTELAMTVAQNEKKIIETSTDDSFSLYISIPFCPTRCSYCSFVSHSISNDNARNLIPKYIDYLKNEINYTAEIANKLNLKLNSIYFGGGTPGILSPDQTDQLFSSIKSSFDLTNLKECTFEAGRPDTITEEKLSVLNSYNVDRISINPQTFNQKTLDVIGRKHSVDEIYKAFECARSFNFKSINMDLIAGLPNETLADYIFSVNKAIELNPDNITIHSLALKRSSNMNINGSEVKNGSVAKLMLDYSQKQLKDNGFIPYYMYRQSKCVGNLENVGWCQTGKEGFYNVIMMEEIHTVLSCGAGSVTKLCNGRKVERIFNYKYPFEYLSNYDVLIDRKKKIMEFYSDIRKERLK